MGGGTSSSRGSQILTTSKIDESLETALRPHRSSVHNDEEHAAMSALNIVLNTDGSRRAFIKYLERTGLSPYLDFYCETESLKNITDSAELLAVTREIKTRYDPGKNKNSTASTTTAEQLWDLLEDFGSDQNPSDVFQEFDMWRNRVMKKLFEMLPEFMNSSEYASWDLELRQLDEKRLLRRLPSELSISRFPDDALRSCADRFPNLLLVDDSNVATKLISNMLTRNGHNVTIAMNGRIALDFCSTVVFDIILIDLFMPVMDGFEAVSQFRQFESKNQVSLKASKRTIVFGMSADSDSETEDKAKRAGLDYFMMKPFTLNKFNSIINMGGESFPPTS